MHFVRKISVRTQLTVAFLLVILASWVISTVLANYFNYLSIKSIHNEMLRNPNVYPFPIPEPKLGIVELFLGPPRPIGPPPPPRSQNGMPPPPRMGPQFPGASGTMPPPPGGPRAMPPPNGFVRPPGPPPPGRDFNAGSLALMRIGVAFVLALLAGAWLGRRFTRPLTALSEGAKAFHSGDFEYRIPEHGEDEFTEVAGTMNEMAERVSQQIHGLEEDANRRRQFLADVAHELRSPVTTMKTMAGALQDGLAEDPDRKERAVGALVRTSERLLRLVVDLMVLAKLDLDELPLSLREMDVREVVNAAIQSHEDKAAEAGIDILGPASGSPITIKIDPDRITQVLDNLIENAVNYAGRGARVQVTLEDGDPVKITVSDNGSGIPSKSMQYIFDPFYRVDSARTPGESHSGLGLRIARGIAKAHGGDLVLRSTEGQGTAARITLPRQ